MKVEIHGHRGAKAIYPENTLPGFQYAFENGIDKVELDVHLTRDGEVVVIHDPIIKPELFQNADGTEVKIKPIIWKMEWTDLDRFEFRTKHPTNSNNKASKSVPRELLEGVTIPKLEEVFRLGQKFSNLNIQWDIEIKYDASKIGKYYPKREYLIDKIFSVMQKFGVFENSVLFSFDRDILRLVKKKMPSIRINYLYEGLNFLGPIDGIFGRHPRIAQWSKALREADEIGCDVFSPNYRLIETFPSIKKHFFPREKRRMQLIPWTVNSESSWRKLIQDFEVDGIITDKPVECRSFLESL